MLKKIFVSIALPLLSLLLFFGVLEAGMRIAGYEPYRYVNLELYRDMNRLYRPNSEGRWYGPLGNPVDFGTTVRTNSLGLHDSEHAVEKPEGVFRILVLGDSFVEAWQVELEKTFFKTLERRLGPGVEVISIGGSGNGAIRERILLETKGLKYRPDLVITLLTQENDFHDDYHYARRMTDPSTYKHVNLKPADTVYDKLKFYDKVLVFESLRVNQWFAFLLTQARTKTLASRKEQKPWEGNLGLYGIPGTRFFKGDDTDWQKAFLLTAGTHVRMKELSAEAGAKYAVVFVDDRFTPERTQDLLKKYPGLQGQVDFGLPRKRMRAVLEKNSIPYLDLSPVFNESTKRGEEGHFKHDGHWNAAGHVLAALAIEKFLYNEKLYEV